MMRSAVLSDDGLFRYDLRREWWPERGIVCFVMLNPSTADAEVDDPTIRKCVGFTQRWGYGGIRVVNLFAFRSSDPTALRAHFLDVSPANPEYIRQAITETEFTVAAWGGGGGPHLSVAPRAAVIYTAKDARKRLVCLGRTATGDPRHPGRLGYKTPLEPYGMGW